MCQHARGRHGAGSHTLLPPFALLFCVLVDIPLNLSGTEASVNSTQSLLLNTLFRALLPGTNVQLSVLDWNALAGGDVKLGLLLERLRVNLGLSNTSQVLDSTITLNQLLLALAQVAQADGNTALVNALNLLQVPLGPLNGTVRLGGSGCINVTGCSDGRRGSGSLRASRRTLRRTTTCGPADLAAV